MNRCARSPIVPAVEVLDLVVLVEQPHRVPGRAVLVPTLLQASVVHLAHHRSSLSSAATWRPDGDGAMTALQFSAMSVPSTISRARACLGSDDLELITQEKVPHRCGSAVVHP